MLKLMNSVLMLLILCGGFHSTNGEALQCSFGNVGVLITNFYTCSVTALENPNDNKIITRYSGVHQANKFDRDVKQMFFSDLDIIYIPADLGSLFDLTTFIIRLSKLVEIRSKDFLGMKSLEYLSLRNNKLTFVPSDAFFYVKNLKFINLNGNQIKYIRSRAFDQLTNLNQVQFDGNICLTKVYVEATAITQMKEDIKVNCDKPNDIIQYEIEQKIREIRDESTKTKERNREEIKDLNEMVKQLLKESKQHHMDRQENIKLRAELSTTKDEHKIAKDLLKTEQDKNTKVLNEKNQIMKKLSEELKRIEVISDRDQLIKELSDELTDLKKELTEAKVTIEQQLPKMEQTINEFHMEVMDQKIERHHQRELYREIRSKLIKCEINERSLI